MSVLRRATADGSVKNKIQGPEDLEYRAQVISKALVLNYCYCMDKRDHQILQNVFMFHRRKLCEFGRVNDGKTI